jgi:hypothetical protein
VTDVAPAGATITLDRGRLEIDSVREGGSSRAFVVDGTQVRITLPRGRLDEKRMLTVSYRGAPSSGLVFDTEREQIYTVFSTSQWMVAIDEPSARATLRLRLTMPRAWTRRQAVARSLDTKCQPRRSSWNGSRIGPCRRTRFGFAAGAFSEVTDRAGRTRCASSEGLYGIRDAPRLR